MKHTLIDLPTHIPHIVYDQSERKYYNRGSDIYLSYSDEVYNGLVPSQTLVCPLPEEYRNNPNLFCSRNDKWEQYHALAVDIVRRIAACQKRVGYKFAEPGYINVVEVIKKHMGEEYCQGILDEYLPCQEK